MTGKIMFLDGDPRVEKFYKEYLRLEGFEIDLYKEFNFGAYQKLKNNKYDLIICAESLLTDIYSREEVDNYLKTGEKLCRDIRKNSEFSLNKKTFF